MGVALAVPPASSIEAVLSNTAASGFDAGLAAFSSQPITLSTAAVSAPEPSGFVALCLFLGTPGVLGRAKCGGNVRNFRT
jgi:hypothetical protein